MSEALVIKRLYRDLKELRQNPIIGASAEPLEDNIKKWHFTVVPPDHVKSKEGQITQKSIWRGVPFHGLLEFNNNYPTVAPKVYFLHPIPKGNSSVQKEKQGYEICMNLSSNFDQYHSSWKNSQNEGWSPGFTVSTFLILLQQMILDCSITRDIFDSSFDSTIKNDIVNLKCTACNHEGSHPSKYKPEMVLHDYIVEELENEHKQFIKTNLLHLQTKRTTIFQKLSAIEAAQIREKRIEKLENLTRKFQKNSNLLINYLIKNGDKLPSSGDEIDIGEQNENENENENENDSLLFDSRRRNQNIRRNILRNQVKENQQNQQLNQENHVLLIKSIEDKLVEDSDYDSDYDSELGNVINSGEVKDKNYFDDGYGDKLNFLYIDKVTEKKKLLKNGLIIAKLHEQQFLDDLYQQSKVIQSLKPVVVEKEKPTVEIKYPDLICYSTQEYFEEDPKMILGVGIRDNKDRFGRIEELLMDLEMLSKSAYDNGVDKNSQKVKIDRWIPLYINETHWKLAQNDFEQLVKKTIPSFRTEHTDTKLEKDFSIDSFHLIGNITYMLVWKHILNTRSISDNFLIYLYSVYRIGLEYVKKSAFLQTFISSNITNLLNSYIKRTNLPSKYIYEWNLISCLSDSTKWNQLVLPLVKEIIYHNHKYYVIPNIFIWEEGLISRPIEIFNALKKMLQNVCIIFHFIRLVNKIGYQTLDQNNGHFPVEEVTKFKELVKKILQINDWEGFFQIMELGKYNKLEMNWNIIQILKCREVSEVIITSKNDLKKDGG